MNTLPLPSEKLNVDVVVKELFDGHCVAYPVANPTLVSHGTVKAALDEVQTFLEAYLRRVDPEVLGRFSLPPGITLVDVDVKVRLTHVPRGLYNTPTMTMPCVLLPAHKARWVMILPLQHTFYVKDDDDLDEAIAEEAHRVWVATEPEPWDALTLLPGRRHRIERLSIDLKSSKDSGVEGRTGSLRQRLLNEHKRQQAIDTLNSIARPLHNSAQVRRGPELVGHQEALETLTALMGGKDRLAAVVVGPELAGKSALIHQWLRQAGPDKPLVYATSGAQLIAGMSGLGQWQARVRRVMEAAELTGAVLYFENLGDIFGDRGHVDMPSALKPFLEAGRVRLLGELSPEAQGLFESRHVGFFGCLSRIRVDPLDADQAAEALRRRMMWQREHQPDRPTLGAEAITPLVDLVERYMPYQAFPGKAVRLFEELRDVAEKQPRGADGSWPPIGEAQIYDAFAARSGIPAFLLREDQALRRETLEASLSKRLIGQKDAVRRVAQSLCVVKARLQPAGKPLATYLFVGPTGVGKTEMARSLADVLFSDASSRLVRFDMSEYMDAEAADRLIRGTQRGEGILTRQIRRQPFCVLLLDEIEKAHPAVFDLLLQVCGEGRLTDARGRTAYFHNALIIMTSNLGAAHRRESIGVGAVPEGDRAHYQKFIESSFRPEFIGRLDSVVIFEPLTAPQIQEVAQIVLRQLCGRRGLMESGVALKVTPAAIERLASDAYAPEYGARALRRHMEAHLITPISALLAALPPSKHGGVLHARLEGEPSQTGPHPTAREQHGELVFELQRGRGNAASRQDMRSALEVSAWRRHMDDILDSSSAFQVVDRLQFLTSQLTTASAVMDDHRVASDMRALRREHHRLQRVWKAVEGHKEELELMEEMAMSALFEGTATQDYAREAQKRWGDSVVDLTELLLTPEPHRDSVTLLIQELDKNRGFDLWLVGFLSQALQRSWQVVAHIDGAPTPEGVVWHEDVRWGPPTEPSEAIDAIVRETRSFQNVLLRVNGPGLGALMALEVGLHRWPAPHSKDPTAQANLLCHCISPRTEFSQKEWREDPGLYPPAPLPEDEVSARQAVRRVTPDQTTVYVGRAQRQLNADPKGYWAQLEAVALAHLRLLEDGDLREDTVLFEERVGKTTQDPQEEAT